MFLEDVIFIISAAGWQEYVLTVFVYLLAEQLKMLWFWI